MRAQVCISYPGSRLGVVLLPHLIGPGVWMATVKRQLRSCRRGLSAVFGSPFQLSTCPGIFCTSHRDSFGPVA